jgi:hypothetical protein
MKEPMTIGGQPSYRKWTQENLDQPQGSVLIHLQTIDRNY